MECVALNVQLNIYVMSYVIGNVIDLIATP